MFFCACPLLSQWPVHTQIRIRLTSSNFIKLHLNYLQQIILESISLSVIGSSLSNGSILESSVWSSGNWFALPGQLFIPLLLPLMPIIKIILIFQGIIISSLLHKNALVASSCNAVSVLKTGEQITHNIHFDLALSVYIWNQECFYGTL